MYKFKETLIALDKRSIHLNNSLTFPWKHVVGSHWNCLTKAIPKKYPQYIFSWRSKKNTNDFNLEQKK